MSVLRPASIRPCCNGGPSLPQRIAPSYLPSVLAMDIVTQSAAAHIPRTPDAQPRLDKASISRSDAMPMPPTSVVFFPQSRRAPA